MPRSAEAVRIDAFDALLDAIKSVQEELNPGQPLNEEQLVQACHELVFEGSPAQVRTAIALLEQLIAE